LVRLVFYHALRPKEIDGILIEDFSRHLFTDCVNNKETVVGGVWFWSPCRRQISSEGLKLPDFRYGQYVLRETPSKVCRHW